MKKCLLISVALFAIMGCSKEPVNQTEVTVSLDYSFVSSGQMVKSASSIYDDFYSKYVETKLIAPKTFTLKFTNKETGATATMYGDWGKNHTLKLMTGEYEVIGTSHPIAPTNAPCIDSLYLSFNESITINDETQNIGLTANYDSFMLIFDKGDKTKIVHHTKTSSGALYSYDTELAQVDNIFYAYMNSQAYYNNTLYIYHEGVETPSSIGLNDIPFEKGKYYYFNDLSNSFDIPPMEPGN